MWCVRKLSHRMDWEWEPACTVLFFLPLFTTSVQRKSAVQDRPWSRSDPLIKIAMKSSFVLWAQLQVAHRAEVLSNNRTPFFQGLQDIIVLLFPWLSGALDRALKLPPFLEGGEAELARWRESLTSAKALSSWTDSHTVLSASYLKVTCMAKSSSH